MTLGKNVIVGGTLLGAFLCSAAAFAQQPFENTDCRAGTISVLAKTDDMFVQTIDHRGISRSTDESKLFDNFTQRCVGVVASVAGKLSANGWCRLVDPSNGDAIVLDWTGLGKPGTGTFKFVHGTGKWKGITGGGEYAPVPGARPVDDGTYQNCILTKGTLMMPK